MKKHNYIVKGVKIICIISFILLLSGCDEISYYAALNSNDSKRLCQEIEFPPPPAKMDSCRILAALVITKGSHACEASFNKIWYSNENEKKQETEGFWGAFKSGFTEGYMCSALETKATQLKIYKISLL
jgi:hypothetical protein